MDKIRGKVIILGDDVDTDQILPGYAMSEPYEEIGKYAMAGEIIEVDLEKGTITAPCGVIESAPLSESVLKTLEYGGLIPRVRAELGITD